jgi:RND family efflux transporter MFP subunit
MKSRRSIILIAVAALAAIYGLVRLARPGQETQAAKTPTIAVAAVTRQNLYEELTVQAEFRPYLEVELYSKVPGYLKTINVDFGDRVRAGDLIATIEVPELQNELDRALAAQQRAEADYRDAHLDYTRLAGVNQSQPNLIAQQDLDAAEARDHATAAAVGGAKADVGQYRTMIGYTRILAPFDGVVTARYADPGALIQAASSTQTQARPLIRLSENQLLRLDFPVSVSYSQEISVGDPVEIHLEGSGRVLTAKITRFTRKVAMDTRTMETEVEVPNPDLKLIPGMYATAVLRLNQHPGALALPVEAVSATNSSSVYLIDGSQQIEERPVKLGIESPDSYEVLSGLNAGDLVVIGSRAGIQPGEKVIPKLVETPKIP